METLKTGSERRKPVCAVCCIASEVPRSLIEKFDGALNTEAGKNFLKLKPDQGRLTERLSI